MYQMIIDLIKLKYVRNPCNKCLVQPACREKCYKFKKHLDSRDTLWATFFAFLVVGLTFLGSHIYTGYIKS
jgi:hypothetical protein